MLHRLSFLLDKSALILILPALLLLFLISPAMARTLIEWTAFAFVLSGAAILITRLTFPQVRLTSLVKQSTQGNMAASLLASSVVVFVGIVIVALVLWAKA